MFLSMWYKSIIKVDYKIHCVIISTDTKTFANISHKIALC